jgi:ABC-2 type transport system permease protein
MIHPNKMLMLVRREVWENRSLWITPLVLSAVILVSAAFSGAPVVDGHGGMHFGPAIDPATLPSADPDRRDGIYAGSIAVLTLVQLLVSGIVVFFYLLDSLLGERKDRSILFWKSLPISDSEVVLSKTATALVLAPAIVLAVSAVTQILFGAIIWLRFHDTPLGGWVTGWNPSVWIQVQAGFLALVPAVVVWYLPLAGYLLLVSVWARKNAFLWAVLPPAAVLLVEAMILQSHNFADFLGRRFAGVFMVMDLPDSDGLSAPSLGILLSHVARVFTHAETWLGVLVAIGFIVAAIRIRRYRDDS